MVVSRYWLGGEASELTDFTVVFIGRSTHGATHAPVRFEDTKTPRFSARN